LRQATWIDAFGQAQDNGPRFRGANADGVSPDDPCLPDIHIFRKLNRQGPAEADMAKFFGLTPPSVHGMVVKLEELGLVTREPGMPRSIRNARAFVVDRKVLKASHQHIDLRNALPDHYRLDSQNTAFPCISLHINATVCDCS